jgi:hypothetical protein
LKNETIISALSYITAQTNAYFEGTKEEGDFRLRYANELRKKRQCGLNNYYGNDELLEERKQVNQQQMKTPGRKGEAIKNEEINKEISRRLLSHPTQF